MGAARAPAPRTRCPTAARSPCTATCDATAASLDAATPGTVSAGRGSSARCLTASTRSARHALRLPAAGRPLRLLVDAGPARALGFARLVPGSARSLGRRLFASGGARAWLYGAAGHGDTAPDGRGSAIAAVYLNLLGHAVGWPSPRGGAQALTDALVGLPRPARRRRFAPQRS